MYGKILACFLTMAPLPLLVSSCTCRDAIPLFVQSQNLTDEAAQALAKAESIVNAAGDNISTEHKIKIQRAIVEAHTALQKANIAIRKAKEECESPNYPAIFKEFNAAWTIVREILPFILAKTQKMGFAGSTVDDPTVYTFQ